MNIRLANTDDLPQLKAVYRQIIKEMEANNIRIWDEIYPCEYFIDDIIKQQLYVVTEKNEILSAFTLSPTNPGADSVAWANKPKETRYLDRLGVNTRHLRKGIATQTLKKAITLAKTQGAETLRLFVVETNQPAINLYLKNGFQQAKGTYNEKIDETLTLHEYGFEIPTS